MRSLQISDLDVAAIWSDRQVTCFLPSQTEKLLQSFIPHRQQRGYRIWAIVEPSSSKLSAIADCVTLDTFCY